MKPYSVLILENPEFWNSHFTVNCPIGKFKKFPLKGLVLREQKGKTYGANWHAAEIKIGLKTYGFDLKGLKYLKLMPLNNIKIL